MAQAVTRCMVFVLGACLVAGCYGSSVQTPRIARLRMVIEPDDARVYANGRFLGSARRLAAEPKELRPGVRYLTIEAPGHFPHDLRVDLPPGTTTIEVALRPVPP